MEIYDNDEYELNSSKVAHKICCMQSIGWADPFPHPLPQSYYDDEKP